MRSCTRPCEPFEAQVKPLGEYRGLRRVQEGPLRDRDKRAAGRGKPRETKSLREHLIERIEER